MTDFLGSFSTPTQGGNNDVDDFERAASAFPDISLDGSGDIPSISNNNDDFGAGSGFSFDDFDSAPVAPVKVTGDDEIDKFESDFPELDVTPLPVQPIAQPSFTTSATPFAPIPQPSALASTPILSQTIEDEPEVIREWREKQRAEIQARDDAAKAKRQEIISKAERSIDEFYEDYARKKERNIRENKDAEADYLASLEGSLSSGTTWGRICEFVELQNSQSKTIARTGNGTTDLTRFKEVLLRLRKEGDKAPGAAGY